LKNRIVSLLKIDLRESEKGIFSLLSFNSLFTGFSTAFFVVATSSFFIKNLSVSQLPIAFIFSGLVGFALVQLYKKLVSWQGLIFAHVSTGFLFGLICLLLFYLRHIGKTDAQIIQFTAYMGFVFIMPFVTVFALVFSSISLQVFDLSQGKRLLALVGLGEIIASVISYLIIPTLVGWWGGSEYLFIVAMVAILISLIPLRKIQIQKNSPVHRKIETVNLSLLAKDSYFMVMALMTLFSVCAVFLVDYSYLLTVKFISTANHIDTAILVSFVFCVIKFGELIASIYSSRFNSTHGLVVSLLILPVLLVGSSSLGFISGLFMPDQYLIITTFLLINKVFERAVRKGILVPSQKVLFQVTKAEERAKIQTLIDGSFTQIATFFAGILLLVCSLFFHALSAYWYLYVLAIFSFLLSIGWFFATKKVYQFYKLKIQNFLNQDILKFSTAKEKSIVSEWFDSIPKKQADLESVKQIHKQLLVIESQVQSNSQSFFLEKIKFYNSREFKQVDTHDPKELFRLCSKAYFHTDSFESRLSISCFAAYFSVEQKYEFIKENYRNLSHHLQHALLHELTKNEPFNLTDPAERFYISELCIECCQLIFWIELTLEDIKDKSASELSTALISLRRIEILHLFELLKLVYNSSSIDIIVNVWKKISESVENQAFAIELLENLLDGNLKKMIIPLLSDMPIELKKERLDELLQSSSLGYPNRLFDLTLSNMLQIDPSLKEMAANLYAEYTSDPSIFKYFNHDLNIRLYAVAEGGQYQADFNDIINHLRDILHLKSNSNYLLTEDFIFQSFFKLNTQLGFQNTAKSNQKGYENQSEFELQIQINEIDCTFSTYNFFLYLYLTHKY
jgi:hypothetical protein